MSSRFPPPTGASKSTLAPSLDQAGRPLRDLRLSVTDRCNFRCRYCMPRDRVDASGFLPRASILSFEEMARAARASVQLGVQKIRVTGGEPLLRRDLVRLIEMLSALSSDQMRSSDAPLDLALTTNGVLLPHFAAPLKAAGLGRITVSLDAIDERVFQRMSDAPAFGSADVLRGIDAALQAGFGPVKVNCVVRRGVNEAEVKRIARHFLGTGCVVRFIEFMDVGTRNGWTSGEVFSEQEMTQQLRELGSLTPLPPSQVGEVSHRYLLQAADGRRLEVGVIASVTAPFCGDCCRARLSADGRLFTCLFASQGHSIFQLLRQQRPDAELVDALRLVWQGRTDRYSEQRSSITGPRGPFRLPVMKVEMSTIGG